MGETGLVVVLDGPTLVGRSTTLAGLQAAWPQVRSGPLLEVGLDLMLRSFGPGARRWQRLVLPTAARGQGDQHAVPHDPVANPDGRSPHEADDQVGRTLAADVVDIDLGPDPDEDDMSWMARSGHGSMTGLAPGVWWGPLGREVVRGMHRAVAAWAHAGIDVAVDHLLVDRATAQDLNRAMDGLRMVHVGLVCDPDVLEARESEARLPVGTAAAQQHAAGQITDRDLILDTSQSSTGELVEAILVEVRRTLRVAP